MKQAEPHKHSYTKLDFIRELDTTKDPVINRIILGRRCSCEKFEAFEMGGKQEMRDLYKRLVMEGKHENEDTTKRPNIVRADDTRMG